MILTLLCLVAPFLGGGRSASTKSEQSLTHSSSGLSNGSCSQDIARLSDMHSKIISSECSSLMGGNDSQLHHCLMQRILLRYYRLAGNFQGRKFLKMTLIETFRKLNFED